MRTLLYWLPSILLLLISLSACTAPASPSSPPVTQGDSSALTGPVVERLDSPPYSLLRIQTPKGDVWAGVPMATIDTGKTVTVSNGAEVRNFEAKTLGRTFDSVVFGAVEDGG